MQMHYLIPEQLYGLEKNLEHHIAAESTEDAEDWFVESKDRLLDVRHWQKFSPVFGAVFHLRDSHGKEVSRHAHKGDHILIDITDAAGKAKENYDWVVIDAMEYDDFPDESRESFAIRLAPTVMPSATSGPVASDFFNRKSTSTLVIERTGKDLYAYYHGRNEATAAENKILPDGESNAWLGMAEEQWVDLLKGFIE